MRLALVSLLVLTTVTSAFAQRHPGQQRDRIQLHLDQHLRGQQTIALKRELRYQHPGLNLRNLKLKAVRLVAKSARGMGEATLSVGQNQSYPVTIGGHPQDFHVNAPYTFQRVRIQNPSYDSMGRWQIHTRGNIKVKKVVLIVENPLRAQTVRLVVRQNIQGQGVIPLKRMIMQQNPYINLQDMELTRVSMLAKSARGRGQATLLVGQSAGYPSTIYGNPRDFQSNHPSSFSMVTLEAPYTRGMGRGRWQIELRGRIKVKEVIVTLRSKSQPDNGGFGGPRGRRGGRYNIDMY